MIEEAAKSLAEKIYLTSGGTQEDCKNYANKYYNLYRTEAIAVLEAAEAVRPNDWQPIETAPKDGTEIIITNGYEIYTARYYEGVVTNNKPWFAKSADGELFNDGYDHENRPVYMYKPTHWQPLPEITKEIIDE